MMTVCALQPGGVRARCRSKGLWTPIGDWRVYVCMCVCMIEKVAVVCL